jgi:hypothetical protein
VTSADEASKLNVTLASGCSVRNAAPISVNDSVSDAAANTVMAPVAVGVEAGVVVAGFVVVDAAFVVLVAPAAVGAAEPLAGAAVAAAAVVVVSLLSLSEPHAPRRPSRATAAMADRAVLRTVRKLVMP